MLVVEGRNGEGGGGHCVRKSAVVITERFQVCGADNKITFGGGLYLILLLPGLVNDHPGK